MNPSRVLVTGATSRLGRAVGRCLKRLGHSAHATIRTKQPVSELPMFDHLHYLELSDPTGLAGIHEQYDSVILALPLITARPAT